MGGNWMPGGLDLNESLVHIQTSEPLWWKVYTSDRDDEDNRKK